MTRNLRALCAGLALALLPLSASPAHADDSRYEGGCGYDTLQHDDATGPGHYTGVVYSATALYSRDHGNVVNAHVTCTVVVNGEGAAEVSGWGTGVVAFTGQVSFVAEDTDTVNLCETVDYTSDDTPTTTDCNEATTEQWPPSEWFDYPNALIDWVNGLVVTFVDPAVCDVLPLLAPGVAPVTVDEQGDVFIGPDVFWDCPPYDHIPQPDPPPGTLPPLPDGDPWTGPAGGGYNTGDTGFLLLVTPETRETASACAYAKDPATGAITVLGTTATRGTAAASVRCRLEDTATGAVLYDETVTSPGHLAALARTVAPHAGAVTVCTEGPGTGFHCRPGEPLDRVLS